MCAVELVKDRLTKEEFPVTDKIGARVHTETQKRGVFSRLRGDVYCLAPPIVTTRDQLDRIVNVLKESVEAVLG